MWVLTGFMGAAYWVVPEESRTELHSPKLAYWALALWTLGGVTAMVGYLFRWTAGNKLLEQPLPVKLAIVVVMLMFLYNLGMTIWKAKRLTTTEGVLMAGLVMTALLYLPSLFEFETTRSRSSTAGGRCTSGSRACGRWCRGAAGLPAHQAVGNRPRGHGEVALRDRGIDVHLGLLGTAHHYYFVGVPQYWLPIGGFFSRSNRWSSWPCRPMPTPPSAGRAVASNTLALHWTLGSAIFSALGAGLLGLAHTWPAVNRWTHGTLITSMHGHAAFFGAYIMIVLAVISYALPAMTGHEESERESKVGLWAFWLQVGGMFGMTMALAAAGIGRRTWSASSGSVTWKRSRRSRCTF